jgi:hypothetical protein
MANPDFTTPLKCCAKCKRELPATTEYFRRSSRAKCGLHPRCKQCANADKKEYARKNPEKVKAWNSASHQRHKVKRNAASKAYYEGNKDRLAEASKVWRDANKDKARGYRQKWKRANPEAVNAEVRSRYWRDPEKSRARKREQYAKDPERGRAYARKYYAKNTEAARAACRRWRLQNMDQDRVRRRRRRTLKKGADFGFTRDDERRALEYFNGTCAVCGRQLRDLFGTHSPAFDHWVPLSKGGHTVPTNMVPLCHGVNGCNNRKKDKDAHEWLTASFSSARVEQIEQRIEAYFLWVKSESAEDKAS